MERNAAAGRTFGSIPVATPPPASSPTVLHTKSLTSFENLGGGQGFGVETGSSHALHSFEDNNRSTYADANPTEFTEAFPLKSSAGHNVMSTAQGEGFGLFPFLYMGAFRKKSNSMEVTKGGAVVCFDISERPCSTSSNLGCIILKG